MYSHVRHQYCIGLNLELYGYNHIHKENNIALLKHIRSEMIKKLELVGIAKIGQVKSVMGAHIADLKKEEYC